MSVMATCNLCPKEKPFQVPWDEVGAALMQQHLADDHNHPSDPFRINYDRERPWP